MLTSIRPKINKILSESPNLMNQLRQLTGIKEL